MIQYDFYWLAPILTAVPAPAGQESSRHGIKLDVPPLWLAEQIDKFSDIRAHLSFRTNLPFDDLDQIDIYIAPHGMGLSEKNMALLLQSLDFLEGVVSRRSLQKVYRDLLSMGFVTFGPDELAEELTMRWVESISNAAAAKNRMPSIGSVPAEPSTVDNC